MVRFATPVFHGNGALAGVLVFNIWGESIGRMINRLIPSEEGYAFLVECNAREAERNGIYLFHPDQQCEFGNQTGSKINVFRDNSGEMTGSWMTRATSAFDHPVSRDILIHRFYSPYQTDQRGWIVVIHANRDVFLAPLARMKKIGALLAVLGLAATVGAALFFAQTLTRPLRRIIDGKQQRELSSCDVNELLDQALPLVRLQAEEKKVRIDVIRNDALPRLVVDGHQIEQVCVNILLNAVDAVAPGGEILVRMLRQEFTVSPFGDSETALRHFLQPGAEIVLTDLRMPKMDGIEL